MVAVEGAGASRYFADRVIVDLVGLNDHALVHHPRGGTAHLCHLLRVRRPTWFVLPSSWVPRFAPAWRFLVRASFRRDHYAQVDPPARREVLILQARSAPRGARSLPAAQRVERRSSSTSHRAMRASTWRRAVSAAAIVSVTMSPALAA